MAKTPVKIEIDGYKEREVQMVTYEFDQATDTEGQMSGIPRGGRIVVKVKALNDGTPDLLAWMLERNLPKNGKITPRSNNNNNRVVPRQQGNRNFGQGRFPSSTRQTVHSRGSMPTRSGATTPNGRFGGRR